MLKVQQINNRRLYIAVNSARVLIKVRRSRLTRTCFKVCEFFWRRGKRGRKLQRYGELLMGVNIWNDYLWNMDDIEMLVEICKMTLVCLHQRGHLIHLSIARSHYAITDYSGLLAESLNFWFRIYQSNWYSCTFYTFLK